MPRLASTINLSQDLLIDAPIDYVWDILADTNALNRRIGLPKVSYSEPIQPDAIHLNASASFYRFRVSWREYPFNWERHKNYSVLREFRNGPIKDLKFGINLQQQDAKTVIQVKVAIKARSLIYIPICYAIARKIVRDISTFTKRIKYHSDQIPKILDPEVTSNANLVENCIKQLTESCNISSNTLNKFKNFVLTATDHELISIRPYELAHKLQVDRDELVNAILHSVPLGLLNMEWTLICPNCQISKAKTTKLADILDTFHCNFCGIDFTTNLDQNTELRFSINQNIRKSQDGIYCIGSPFSMPHVIGQKYIPENSETTFEIDLNRDNYRIRILKLNHNIKLQPTTSLESIDNDLVAVFENNEWDCSTIKFIPGLNHFKLINTSEKPIEIAIENTTWESMALRASDITIHPEFRKLFSAEVVAPGKHLSLKSLTVMFTDLKSSTELYEKIGDAPAYSLVQKHFTFLEKIIEHCQGSIIKTIGDAVMAIFLSPVNAMQAAIRIQTEISDFNSSINKNIPITLKTGLYTGAAIAVNTDGKFDYFGRTINICARIESQSTGGDIVFPEEYCKNQEISDILSTKRLQVEKFTTTLKGIQQSIHLCKVQLPIKQ